MKKKVVTIDASEIIGISCSPKNYLVDKLIKNGAPIRVNRESKTDTSEYKDSEIEYFGIVTRYENPAWTYCVYEFEEQE